MRIQIDDAHQRHMRIQIDENKILFENCFPGIYLVYTQHISCKSIYLVTVYTRCILYTVKKLSGVSELG